MAMTGEVKHSPTVDRVGGQYVMFSAGYGMADRG
jgi:hypothetical protein